MPHHLFAAEYHGKQAVGLLFLAGAKRDLTCHRNIANVAACMYHSCVAATAARQGTRPIFCTSVVRHAIGFDSLIGKATRVSGNAEHSRIQISLYDRVIACIEFVKMPFDSC